jgi:hypothetical protein
MSGDGRRVSAGRSQVSETRPTGCSPRPEVAATVMYQQCRVGALSDASRRYAPKGNGTVSVPKLETTSEF